ncbi:putative ABC multidrug transporter [Aspergillus ellipticus CBS 707.79]|uniref:Putative ABC multidrug transporter n=1 Tax=Aspergillus ellipticus CBS 707.79 TaxID=1448320 RepID=A0A319D0A1_9EURO|nr:putative ABC multidrug transporter [Aspergillus ellipticus CBS 707.79]
MQPTSSLPCIISTNTEEKELDAESSEDKFQKETIQDHFESASSLSVSIISDEKDATESSSHGNDQVEKSSLTTRSRSVSLVSSLSEVGEDRETLDLAVRQRVYLDPNEESYLAQLARTNEGITCINSLAGILPADPWFNPDSADFDLYRWLRKLMCMLNQSKFYGGEATIKFQNLQVSGTRPAVQHKPNVLEILTAPLWPRGILSLDAKSPQKLIRNFHGTINSGELLLVLGSPGSGCSTLVKALGRELDGLKLDAESVIYYSGVPPQTMNKSSQAQVIYNSDVDKFFPNLTVGQTLEFAVSSRTSSEQHEGMSRSEYAKLMTKVIIAVFELSHLYRKTVCGISLSERKRVTVAELVLSGASLAVWDKPIQGLDSSMALNFVQSLRLTADLGSTTHIVSAYQANQAIYELFDKTILLYEGRQIYYGSVVKARAFFERQGWYCSPQQTTAEFLTSVTNPMIRKPCPGLEAQVPRAPDEFEAYWQQSPEFLELQREMGAHKHLEMPQSKDELPGYPQSNCEGQAFRTQRGAPYINLLWQIKLNIRRAYQQAWNERASAAYKVTGTLIIALIIGSMFYNTPATTSGFFAKGAVLFYMVMLNSLIPLSEISSQHSRRPVVQKHVSLGFYNSAVGSIAHFLSERPVRFLLVLVNNVVIYFLSNLRREPSQFFLCLIINFLIMLVTTEAFRAAAATTKTVSQAMVVAAMLVLPVVIYTGFIIPVPEFHPWFKFIHYLNPIYYAFEILLANEFHGRHFGCSELIPSYPNLQNGTFICSAVGAVAGRRNVSGDDYIQATYDFTYDHVWRNFGIIFVFMFGWMVIHLLMSGMVSFSTDSTQTLFLNRKDGLAHIKRRGNYNVDEETGQSTENTHRYRVTDAQIKNPQIMPVQQNIFTWRNVVYELSIKGEHRRLLDQVTGWVKPGSLTAVMSVSDTSRKTLIEILAQHTTVGVVTGEMFINGLPLNRSFKRQTSYIQQHDFHLETATVRESLQFNAMLRQPSSICREEKLAYVEDMIKLLGMEGIAEAVVGVSGKGLNREQRKLLSIGVELAARPQLLLLDEPTRGLDAQTSWAIYNLLRKLSSAGQAVLCTIHQPDASIFQQFGQLTFLTSEGKTAYFGPIGKKSCILLNYFQLNGAHRDCKDNENPAEYIVEIVNAGSNKHGECWSEVWSRSREETAIQQEINYICERARYQDNRSNGFNDPREYKEFALPLWKQLPILMHRMCLLYWRSPLSIVSRILLNICAALFIGFSFYKRGSSIQGLQQTIFSVFMLCSLFSSLVQQITSILRIPHLLYKNREHQSRIYSWKVFLLASILIEIPYQIVLSIPAYASYYYAVSGIQSTPRQGLILLFFVQYFLYASTFAILITTISTNPKITHRLTYALSFMSTTFNGVMQPPTALPGLWIFMFRVSPFTYWTSGITATQLHNRTVHCKSIELSIFNPPSGQTCAEYLSEYLETAKGYLVTPNATSNCEYCPLSVADQYLSLRDYHWSQRWRNFGLVWVYIVFNIALAVCVFYVLRVRKWGSAGLLGRVKNGLVSRGWI